MLQGTRLRCGETFNHRLPETISFLLLPGGSFSCTVFLFVRLFNEVMFNTAKEIYCWLLKQQNQDQTDMLTDETHILLNDEWKCETLSLHCFKENGHRGK